MSCSVYLTLPPNILRRAREIISTRYPEVEIGIPDIHEKMFTFASSFANMARAGTMPSLTLTAYPQFFMHAVQLAREGLLGMPSTSLPPLRRELAALGMEPPCPHLRVVTVVPGVIATAAATTPVPTDWSDLCAPEFPGPIGCPPADTPLPYLAEDVLGSLYGNAVSNLMEKLDTSSNPIDINKRIAANQLTAAFIIPAFARTFREGMGRMVWPASGALAIPLLACLSPDAPPAAHEILALLLSEEFQGGAMKDAVLAPVIDGVTAFDEMEANNWNLYWPGWDCLLRVADTMQKTPMPAVRRRLEAAASTTG